MRRSGVDPLIGRQCSVGFATTLSFINHIKSANAGLAVPPRALALDSGTSAISEAGGGSCRHR